MNFEKLGEKAIGSRLRYLSTTVTKDAEKIYEHYGVQLKPKWFPVFYFLSNQDIQGGGESISAIATAIGHTHPSVIKIVREMINAGLVVEQKDPNDGRKNNILLTKKGMQITLDIQNQYTDVESAIKSMLSQTKHNLWLAIQEFEHLLEEKSLLNRVLEAKKTRESSKVTIVDYTSEYQTKFRELNEQWIVKYFKLEDADRKALGDPQGYILDRGGKILVALQDNTVLGVCALLKMEDDRYDYEMAKMAVSPEARGMGIGYLLGKAIINKARELQASNIYLESNTVLEPAIALYEKLGFKRITRAYSPYERCNIQMELKLT